LNARSIRFRLTAWYAGLLAALLVLFGGFIYFTLAQFLESNLRETLSKEAQTIGDALLKNITHTGDAYVANEIEEHFAPRITNHFLRVTRQDHSVLYQSGEPRNGAFDPSQIEAARLDELEAWREERLPNGKTLLVYSMTYSEPTANRYAIQTGAPYEQVGSVLRGLLLSLGIAFPLMLSASIGGGYLLMRRALKPLDEIATTAERITSRNLNERMPEIHTGDELEKLATALNRMMARLEESFHHIHRFSADASHEIRTPLAIIRGELENALNTPALTASLRDTLSSSLEEVERLARIVEQLLEMTRLEAGETLVDLTRVDVAELVRSTVDQMRLLAVEKQVELRFEGAQALPVKCDPLRLKQIVVNLVDNAIKYTPSGGSVLVSSFPINEKAVLEVTDTGVGIPAQALPRVFDRFYRVDGGRSRQTGGTGLGLAIVKSISTAFGGVVTVNSTEGSGAVFRVELPLEPQS
jgi:heavy metal sensor kinase